MIKKIFLGIAILLFLGATFVAGWLFKPQSKCLNQQGVSPSKTFYDSQATINKTIAGLVVANSTDTLKINVGGKEVTVLAGPKMTFSDKTATASGTLANFKGVTVGKRVMVILELGQDEMFTTKFVMILSDDAK